MTENLAIEEFMTPCPFQIEASASLEQAEKEMKMRSIRHVPVVSNGVVQGVLSERDLKMSALLCETTGNCPLVGGLELEQPYVVSPQSLIAEVAGEMARNKFSCAIVADDEGSVIGIFTTTDACRVIELVLGSEGE